MSPSTRLMLFCVAALPLLWCSYSEMRMATGGEFTNIIGELYSLYGGYYAVLGAVKAFNTWRKSPVVAAGAEDDGAWLFTGGSTLMNGFYFLTILFSGSTVHMPPILGLVLFFVVAAIGLFGPWAVLFFAAGYRHLRTQAVWGLASLLLLPFAAAAAALSFAVVWQHMLLAPILAVVCLGFLAARKMGSKLRMRLGLVVIALTLSAFAAFWLHMRPYWAADEAAYSEYNFTKAIEILRPLGEAGDENAAFRIGLFYTAAMNKHPDPAAALKWLIVSANNGGVYAAWLVARAYLDGEGTEKNPAEALKWMQMAADGGETGAQLALGDFYRKGENGLPLDMKKAVEWTERAAKQGQPEAYEKIYWLYRKGGPGVQPDLETAYFWYLVWRDHNMDERTFLHFCPDTKEVKDPPKTGAMTFRDMLGDGRTQNCEDKELLPLLRPQQIDAAKARFDKWSPKAEQFWNKLSF